MMDGIGAYRLGISGRCRHSAYGKPGEGEGSWCALLVFAAAAAAIGIIGTRSAAGGIRVVG